MACLIVAEAAIFIIFVVAYIFYIGKSLSGPTPAQVLELPIFGTVCLLSSSITVHLAVSALRKGNLRNCTPGLAGTVLLGSIFLGSTAQEWYHLIHDEGLTIQTNLFGTTYYSLVGLHATHVVVGLVMLSLTLAFSFVGAGDSRNMRKSSRRCRFTGTLSMVCGWWCLWWFMFWADRPRTASFFTTWGAPGLDSETWEPRS